jgi:hypothetical protein
MVYDLTAIDTWRETAPGAPLPVLARNLSKAPSASSGSRPEPGSTGDADVWLTMKG